MATQRRSPWGRRARAAVGLILALVLVGGVGVGATVLLLEHQPAASPQAQCTAQAGDLAGTLSPEQADNAALIVGITLRRGLPARAATIALATAMQESSLRNLDYGDRDSLGLFQQRPSQGWGTAEQLMDPVYATTAFLDRLLEVPGYTTMEITDAAQAVQRSAFPQAYAQHEHTARAWAAALTGAAGARLWCSGLPDAVGSQEQVAARVARDLGDLPITAVVSSPDTPGGVDVRASALPGMDPTAAASAVGRWAVAIAAASPIVSVQVGNQVWERATSEWSAAPDAVDAGVVRILVASTAGG